jgi:hypothetical protein
MCITKETPKSQPTSSYHIYAMLASYMPNTMFNPKVQLGARCLIDLLLVFIIGDNHTSDLGIVRIWLKHEGGRKKRMYLLGATLSNRCGSYSGGDGSSGSKGT